MTIKGESAKMVGEETTRSLENDEIREHTPKQIAWDIGDEVPVEGLSEAEAERLVTIDADAQQLPQIDFELKYQIDPPTQTERYVGAHDGGNSPRWSEEDLATLEDYVQDELEADKPAGLEEGSYDPK